MRTSIKPTTIVFLMLSMMLPFGRSLGAAPLYFPHVAATPPWQTEIAVINTSPDQSLSGILRAFDDNGQPAGTKNIALPGRGRFEANVAERFKDHAGIRYLVFDTESDAVRGYAKFYRDGSCRAAIPAVSEVNTADIQIPHIASNTEWWTGVSLVNTTSGAKRLPVVGNNRQGREFTLDANRHRAFDIADLFGNQPQPAIHAGWIANAAGIIGLELFGDSGDGNRLDGILATDRIASTLYIPHVAGDGWRTDIAIYNPLFETNTVTITPFSSDGTPLGPTTRSLAALEKFTGTVSDLGLPAETAWLRIDAMRGITGLEILGAADGGAIAAYAGTEAAAAREGVFPKIERSGWTGIALVNTEDTAASVTLTALDDHGAVVATRPLAIGAYAKWVDRTGGLFPGNIGDATYMTYTSDRELVGFQLNGSSDGTMLDALPALVEGGPPAPVWQQPAGPEGGDINVIAVDPTDSLTVYAGVNGGGVFKTTDGGASWKAVNTGLTTYYIRSIAIDPQDHRIVYAGTDGGIFKTTDGGAFWTAINQGLTNSHVRSLVIDPGDSQVVYAGIAGSGGAGTDGGVYKTTDGGSSWTAMNAGLASTRVTCLVINPAESGTLYAGIWDVFSTGADGKITSVGGGVYKTTDGAGNWTKMEIDTGSAYTVIPTTLAIDPKNSRTVYAVVGSSIFKTTNAGASWTALNTAAITTGITAFVIDPANSKTFYAGTGGAFGCGGAGYNGGGCGPDIPGAVFKTVNGGKTWTTVKTGNANDSVHSLAVDPSKSGAVYVGTNNSGVFKTTDGGASWMAIHTGTVGDVESFAIDPDDSRILYAGVWGGGSAGISGVYKTTDGGVSWTAMNTGLTNNNVQTLAIDPANGRIVYAGTFFGGVFKTTNGGASWTAVNNGITNKIINCLVVDPADSRIVYAGTDYTEPGGSGGGLYSEAAGDDAGGGVFKTTDGGASWTALENGIPRVKVSSLAIDPENSLTVYAGTGQGVFKTTDGGASWTALDMGIQSTYGLSLAIDPTNSRTVYAGTGQGVFKTNDGGASWTAISTGITNTNILSLAIDPSDSRTVYAGTLSSGGIFRTTNGGASWKAVNAGLTHTLINSIAVDPANSGMVYAGTGGGVFKTME